MRNEKSIVEDILDERSTKDGSRKRRREEEQAWKKVVKRKLKDEDARIATEEETSCRANKELYALFNDLQGISKE